MSTRRRIVHATPQQVWDVLADGWLYPVWVVGASRMREVEDHWPVAGARLHHSVGVWPAMIDDNTEVLLSRPPAHLRLRARGWPLGEAQVDVRIEAHDQGSEVSITEDAVSGPGRLLPKPARDLAIGLRNVETLQRLAFIAENRADSLR
ncbi:SRPBCC family protein [Nocardioides rubriscoriae]|uniref:SRPBCC family protein n=1 Tax=Nocardioides rubriscoriae TaxID=642762 RepID=UPI0011E031C8|nr:SRPBCC family protein [Nocardioides rubriscoriae]